MSRFLLFFGLISPMFLKVTVCQDQNNCSYNESLAINEGRSCANKQCDPDTDKCKGQRTCVCDGACGFRCISIRNSAYCTELNPPVNGSVVYLTEDRSFGSIASYKCSPGYLPSPSVERRCLGDKKWSNEETPECLPQEQVCPALVNTSVTCPPSCTTRRDCPQKVLQECLCNGNCGMSCLDVYVPGFCPSLELTPGTKIVSMKPRGRLYSSVATLGCQEHFEMESGSLKTACRLDGNWSSTALQCKPQPLCESLPHINHTEHNGRGKVLHPGDTIIYNCRVGYHYYGNGETSTCQNDLSWTPVDLACYPISCGNPGYLRNGWREGDRFTFQSSVTFHCNIGYKMRGFPYRTCLSNQEWSSFMPECVAVQCPQPYPPDHGTKHGSQSMYSAQVYFRCDSGYKLEGSDMRRCQSDGTWSGDEPTCRLIRCLLPKVPQHGSMIAPRQGLNAIIRFSCNPGYTMEGSILSRCTAEETWSEPAPSCQAGCRILDLPQNGYYLDSWDFRPGDLVQHGQVLRITCYHGYVLNSNIPYMCDNGLWSFDAECIPPPCQRRKELRNANITYNPPLDQDLPTVPHSTTFTYTCLYGFQQDRPTSTSVWTCNFGNWVGGSTPECRPKSCPDQGLPDGKVVYFKNAMKLKSATEPHHGVMRSFQCADGFTLVGALSGRASICEDGEWTTPLPTCEPDSCSALEIRDGNVEYTNTEMGHGTDARLTCNLGLKPNVGDGHLECHAGHWVPDGVACVNGDAVTNVAFGKPALQRATSVDSKASQAVDGDRTADKLHQSCFVPRRPRVASFWEVDLEATYMIDHVDIYVGGSNAESKKITVQIGPSGASTEFFTECGSAPITRQNGQPIQITCSSENLYGQLVRIPLNLPNRMTLCEVEVFATGPLKTCPIPDIDNMKMTLDGQDEQLPVNILIASGQRIQYSCNSGYYIRGAPRNHCNLGQWANARPTCIPVPCDVTDPLHGRLNQRVSQIAHGTELDYTCSDEYYEKKFPRIVCELGVLKPDKPSCIPKSCRIDAHTLSNVLINNTEPSLDSDGRIVVPHGTSLQFSCKRGSYMANQNTWNRCWYGDLQYRDSLPSCTVIRCSDSPPYPANGYYQIVEGTYLLHGTIIRYYCYSGYVLEDPHSALSTCDDGSWRPNRSPRCLPQPESEANCPTPSAQNANIFYDDQNVALMTRILTYNHNDQISVQCVDYYDMNGYTTLTSTCLNGLWTPALLNCLPVWYASCPRPENINNVAQYIEGKTKLEDASHFDFKHTTFVELRCRDPLTRALKTEPIRRCNNGRWTGPTPLCVKTNAWIMLHDRWSMTQQYFANGTLLIYPGIGSLSISCLVASGHPELRVGHRESFSRSGSTKSFGVPREGHSGMYICRQLGKPSVSHTLTIQVVAVSCPEDEVRPPVNGHRRGDNFRIGAKVSFECDKGYDLVGDPSMKCFLGKWIGKVPKCQAHDCPEIQLNDPNLIKIAGSNLPGSRMAFECRMGYTLVGRYIIDCEAGNWSHNIPHCEAISTDAAPPDCSCEVWEVCVMDLESSRPICKCIHPQNCPEPDSPDEAPYCGSDGQIYPSICKMKALGCFLNKGIDVVSRGQCPENMTHEVEGDDYSSSADSYYSSEFSESTQDDTTTVPNGGMTTTGTHTTESSHSVLNCKRCTSTDIQRACLHSPYIFVGQPTRQWPNDTYLVYSVQVINPLEVPSMDTAGTNITILVPNFDEVNRCECPGLNINREYLFILDSTIHDNFKVTNSSVVEFWAERSADYHNKCKMHELEEDPV